MTEEKQTEPVKIPANVVIYLRGEIEQRTVYRRELETLQEPPSYRETKVVVYKQEKHRLETNMHNLYNDILAITKKHFPSIEVDPNPETTVANILAALPDPEEVIVKKIFHSNAGASQQ